MHCPCLVEAGKSGVFARCLNLAKRLFMTCVVSNMSKDKRRPAVSTGTELFL